MDDLALSAYTLTVAGFVGRYAALITTQSTVRLGARVFRWPEDAAHWKGEVARQGESERVERAQAALRNDGETLPLFLAAAFAWIALGAAGSVACLAFAAYFVARSLHAWWFVVPRQPARNRAFVLGQLVLLGIVVDAARRAIVMAAGDAT